MRQEIVKRPRTTKGRSRNTTERPNAPRTAGISFDDGTEKCVEFTLNRLGRLDILVNNAGGAPHADAATASPRFSEAIIRLNLIAPLNFAQAANTAPRG